MRLRKPQSEDGPWAAPQIIALRKELNLTQVDLAAKIGTNQVCICRWENGKTRPSRMSMEKLSKIGITNVGILKNGDDSTPAVEPVIEKGIPIPAQGTFTEIARKMQYGDSVLLPYTEARTLMMSIRRTGAYGVQREIGDKLRVWKMEKPVVRRDISKVMSELGKRKKRMSPEAIKARQAAGKASAKARRERNASVTMLPPI